MNTRLGNTTLRVELREDGLDWIAAGHPEWRHPDGSLMISRVAEAAGLHRQSLHRIVTDPTRYPDNQTIAAIVQLGITARRVGYKTAMNEIFRVVDTANQRRGSCEDVVAA